MKAAYTTLTAALWLTIVVILVGLGAHLTGCRPNEALISPEKPDTVMVGGLGEP